MIDIALSLLSMAKYYLNGASNLTQFRTVAPLNESHIRANIRFPLDTEDSTEHRFVLAFRPVCKWMVNVRLEVICPYQF